MRIFGTILQHSLVQLCWHWPIFSVLIGTTFAPFWHNFYSTCWQKKFFAQLGTLFETKLPTIHTIWHNFYDTIIWHIVFMAQFFVAQFGTTFVAQVQGTKNVGICLWVLLVFGPKMSFCYCSE